MAPDPADVGHHPVETMQDVSDLFERLDAVERSIPWEVERAGVCWPATGRARTD